MSLVQHVSSIEGTDRKEFEDSTGKSVKRVLSYDAFPRPSDTDKLPSVGAYNVSKAKRLGTQPIMSQLAEAFRILTMLLQRRLFQRS